MIRLPIPGTILLVASHWFLLPSLADAAPPARTAAATRLMQKFDKNDNGTWEQSENSRAWNRYRKLDTNQDKKFSIDELSQEQPAFLDTDGERKLDLVYKTVGQKELLLDLYYPAKLGSSEQQTDERPTDERCPVIVYTHGGGWAAGSKQGAAKGSFKTVFEQLLQQGFAVASVNYRLCKPNSGVMMRDCVIDSKDAVRYLAKNSQTLRLDPTRFFVMGDSAGGQIAQMLLLTTPDTLPGDEALAGTPYQMLAGVSWYGPSDFEKTELFNHDDRADFRDRFGPRILGSNSSDANKLELYREMSPVNFLRADSPPLLMIQGDKDTTIPVKHAHHMKQKADVIKAPVQVMIIRNAGHNWRKVDADIDPSRDAIVERTVQFFLDHLPN
ncbi:alpha/beta hydrolase [Rhodopirellula europaea]|uniref:Esterase/lipase-like protein n=1 Tax=Rhodopirellula europaea 6C TaxID=1263867 RepID=M2B174_9BACT|nr:alpha/beta hydrolase [Rhodopirellula europaea]EMB18672.1 Esterase/lipase-like protein [Rhodopirellula europaea 6C]